MKGWGAGEVAIEKDVPGIWAALERKGFVNVWERK